MASFCHRDGKLLLFALKYFQYRSFSTSTHQLNRSSGSGHIKQKRVELRMTLPCRISRTQRGALAMIVVLALGGCAGSDSASSSSSAASGLIGGNSSSSISVSVSSSNSSAAIVGVETPSAISVVTATNAN
jgi:hypothetical protein